MCCESRPQFGLLQLLNQCFLPDILDSVHWNERAKPMSKVLSSLYMFTVYSATIGFFWCVLLAFQHGESRGQDLFLEGPIGASLCASSLCALLCAHSSSSALAWGNGQLLGRVRAGRQVFQLWSCIQCKHMTYKHNLVSSRYLASQPEAFVLALASAVAEISWPHGIERWRKSWSRA